MAEDDIPETLAVKCPSCSQTVLSKVCGNSKWYIPESGEGGRYLFASCQGCQKPILFSQSYDDWIDEFEAPDIIFPVDARSFGGNIPMEVQRAFEEAEICLKAGAYSAAALMCRRGIEAIAHDKGAAGRTLVDKIGSLESAGLITAEFKSWFDMLRQVGNQAAHDMTSPVSLTDARDTIDFTHALVEFIYSYRQKFEDFRARRSASNAGNDGTP